MLCKVHCHPGLEYQMNQPQLVYEKQPRAAIRVSSDWGRFCKLCRGVLTLRLLFLIFVIAEGVVVLFNRAFAGCRLSMA